MPEFPLEISVYTSETPAGARRSRALVLALLLAMASLTGCLFRRAPRAFTPPPPVRPDVTAAQKPAPMLEGPDSSIGEALDLPAEIPPSPGTGLDLPGPPPPAAPPVRPPVASAPKPTPALPAGPTPPKIVQIFTPEQQREYNRELDDSLGRVQRALEVVSRKSLTPEQTAAADRIRVFQTQAEQARTQDLVTAVNLARRADLLAKDLLERLP